MAYQNVPVRALPRPNAIQEISDMVASHPITAVSGLFDSRTFQGRKGVTAASNLQPAFSAYKFNTGALNAWSQSGLKGRRPVGRIFQ